MIIAWSDRQDGRRHHQNADALGCPQRRSSSNHQTASFIRYPDGGPNSRPELEIILLDAVAEKDPVFGHLRNEKK